MPFPPGVVRTARGLSRRPGFAAGAILTLAVAIGVNAAVFSVVDAVLLRPLPFPEPDRLSFLTAEPSYFRILGMAPVLGRTLVADDDHVGADPVAILREP